MTDDTADSPSVTESRAPAGEPKPRQDESTAPRVKVVDRRWWAQQDRQESAEGGEDWPQPRKPTYVEQLEQQLAEKDALLKGYVEQYKHAASEFEDARARMRRELSKEIERSRRTFLAELLDVIDDLDRAIDAARETANPAALLKGVELVRAGFLAKLGTLGVRRIEALGQPFDADRHDGIATVPVETPEQDGRVVGVIKQGYLIGDEILRPASVAVGRKTPSV